MVASWMAASSIKVILLTLDKLGILNVILLTLDKRSSNFTDFKQHSQLGRLWLANPHCAAPV